MKRLISLLAILLFAVLVPAAEGIAGSRYYSSHYHGGHRSHYYPHHHRHSSSSDFLAPLGVGLLTGAVVGSLLYQPPVERTVVYSAPPSAIHSSPVVVGAQPDYYRDSEVLRQVKPTVRLLNLRSGPGLDEEVIGQATFDDILGVIGAAPEWLYVKTARGQYGWVKTQYTQALAPVG